MFHGATVDPNADGVNGRPASVWQFNPNQVNFFPKSNNSADQPWLALGNGHAYVSYTSFNSHGTGDVQIRVSASADNGASFTADNSISTNSNGGLDNPKEESPGLRLATDQVGNVYTIYGWNQPPVPKPGEATKLHYRLNMSSDGGQTWKFTDAGGKAGGLVIDDGLSLQLGSSFGGVNRLTGNITAIAADPTGAHVYAVYGKEDATGTDRLYLAEFHPDGSGNLVERASPLPFSVAGQRSALPSVAVTANGTVAVQYDTFTDGDGQFHVHLATSTDQGQTFQDQDVYDFTATGIPIQITDRLLGDYQDLSAVGNTVYGTFAARGNVIDAQTAIDTTGMIDPFFYSVTLAMGHQGSFAASFGGGSALLASPSGSGGAALTGAATPSNPVARTLSRQQVQPLVTEAFARWQAAGVDTTALHGIDIRISDVGGVTLGLASGYTIGLDGNAAGRGWFVDPTPADDTEFTTPGNQGEQHRIGIAPRKEAAARAHVFADVGSAPFHDAVWNGSVLDWI